MAELLEFGTRVRVHAVAYRVTANAWEAYVETEAPSLDNDWKEVKRQGLAWSFSVARSQGFGGITGGHALVPNAHEHLPGWPGEALPGSDEELPQKTNGDGFTRVRRFRYPIGGHREGIVLGSLKRTEGSVWSARSSHTEDDWESGGSHALRTVDLLIVALEPTHRGTPVVHYVWPPDAYVVPTEADVTLRWTRQALEAAAGHSSPMLAAGLRAIAAGDRKET